MALFKCPECGNAISSKAEFCPHCGFTIKDDTYLEIAEKPTQKNINIDTEIKVKANNSSVEFLFKNLLPTLSAIFILFSAFSILMPIFVIDELFSSIENISIFSNKFLNNFEDGVIIFLFFLFVFYIITCPCCSLIVLPNNKKDNISGLIPCILASIFGIIIFSLMYFQIQNFMNNRSYHSEVSISVMGYLFLISTVLSAIFAIISFVYQKDKSNK